MTGVTPTRTSKTRRTDLDLSRLFRLRLAVARHGEMDAAKWWNTQEMLGRRGAIVFKRGFPRTHYFARARVVVEVARSRCAELFNPPGCMTLWSMPAEIEDHFNERWHEWLEDVDNWSPFFDQLATVAGKDLLEELERFELISESDRAAVAKLKRSAENRAVPLPGVHVPTDEVITLLAAGFARGEPGNPAIPYARLET